MSIVVIPVRSRMSGVVACEPVAGTDIECWRVYPIPEELTAPSALRLILRFQGYAYCKSRLRQLPSSPARQVEAARGAIGGELVETRCRLQP
jgi:hypothetical protein